MQICFSKLTFIDVSAKWLLYFIEKSENLKIFFKNPLFKNHLLNKHFHHVCMKLWGVSRTYIFLDQIIHQLWPYEYWNKKGTYYWTRNKTVFPQRSLFVTKIDKFDKENKIFKNDK